jgi:hypothetical protein
MVHNTYEILLRSKGGRTHNHVGCFIPVVSLLIVVLINDKLNTIRYKARINYCCIICKYCGQKR